MPNTSEQPKDSLSDASKRIIIDLSLGQFEERVFDGIDQLALHVGLFSAGKELLFTPNPTRVVDQLGRLGGRILLELNLCDTPATTINTVKAIASHACVRMFTLHLACGDESIDAALKYRGDKLVIGVALLPSIKSAECRARFGRDPITIVVESALRFAERGGDGLICSVHELEALTLALKSIREKRQSEGKSPFLLIVWDSEPPWVEPGAEKSRSITHGLAIKAGADYVIDHSIRRPHRAIELTISCAQKVACEINAAPKKRPRT